eukprot:scaffold4505_cov165-Ochromonas_danica.AAC.5
MDNYHIYEEIGKGAFSQVFKGREKKKIEYFAIKRIEKSAMNKVVAEVQIMHKLVHPHIIRFFEWYETRNNLYLILEYCTGGDLEAILKQDGHLPENSIKIFGVDMIAALKYLHSSGIIHGDLRPKNFLVDENGILKLCDFKYAKKIPKDVLGETPLADRGCPAYMAPELFSEDGTHSFQSDFWALGCVLYELRRGVLPFGDLTTSVDDLIERIRSQDPIASPNNGSTSLPSLSPELADCLLWLLEKAPMNRCIWPALCAHPYWKPFNPSPPSDLPAQPAFDTLVRKLERARSSQLEQATNAEFNVMRGQVQSAVETNDPRGVVPSGVNPSPLKMPTYGATPLRKFEASSSSKSPHHPESQNNQEDKTPANHQKLSAVVEYYGANSRLGDDQSPRSRIPTPMDPQQLGYGTISPARNESHMAGDSSAPLSSNTFLHDLEPSLLLVHPSELAVKPIVGNKQIENIDGFDYQSNLLSFETFAPQQLTIMGSDQQEDHLNTILKVLQRGAVVAQGNTASPNILQVLTERISNFILNSSFLTLLLRLLRHFVNYTTSTPIRGASNQISISNVQTVFNNGRYWCATLLALLLRHSTFIHPPLEKNKDDHIVDTLVYLLRDASKSTNADSRIKRRLVAALGEIIFYITAQDEEDSHPGSKLLEITQNSMNEALLVTAATALSHLIYLVLTAYASVSSDSSLLNSIQSQMRANSSGGGSSRRLSGAGAAIDPFASPLVISAAKFVAKLFEKANFPSIMDLLKDGPPRVQQSLMNIVIMIFCSPILRISSAGLQVSNALDSNQEAHIKSALTPLKSYFLRSHSILLPILFRMMEQSSLTVIRCKALLLCHQLCLSLPSILITIVEKRLPILVMRLLEPVLSKPKKDDEQPSYLDKCALCLVFSWRNTAILSMRQLSSHLEEISKLSPDLLQLDGANGDYTASGTNGSAKKARNPQLFSPTSRSPAKDVKPMERLSFTATQLRQTSDGLRSIISLAASQPALCRLILGGNIVIVSELSKAIRALPIARGTLLSASSKQLSNDMKESILAAEQVCLSCVESISQIEIPEFTFSNLSPVDALASEKKWPWDLDWSTFVSWCLRDLLPSLAQLLAHPDGNIRTVVAACLRKLLPYFIRSYVSSLGDQLHLHAEQHFGLLMPSCRSIMPYISLLLNDQPPIPQYTIRLLVDVMCINREIAVQIVRQLQTSGIVPVILNNLRSVAANDRNSDDGDIYSLDPQLVVLVHGIFEHAEGAEALLEADLGSALSVATIGAVYMSLPFPFDRVTQINSELLVGLAELLYFVLHFVLREISAAEGGGRSPQRHVHAEQNRKRVLSLRATSPALLMLLAFAQDYLRTFPGGSIAGGEVDGQQQLRAVCSHLAELSSRSLGVLFDLFPDALTSQLLSKQSVTLDNKAANPHEAEVLSPRLIIALVLKNKQVDGKVRLKLIKIVLGLLKVSKTINSSAKARELVSEEPLNSAIVMCTKGLMSPARNVESANDVTSSIARVASLILESVHEL